MTLTHWPSDTKGSDTVLATQDYVGNLLDAIHVAQDFVPLNRQMDFAKQIIRVKTLLHIHHDP